ncbi:MAG TPA: hypothetical protein VLG47_04170 [Candidatus Saccharimonadales bacterium]|nr:hypothetical protein [Candidatus Saccharimonadales bacterium]
MPVESDESEDARLLVVFLSPSWLSALVCFLFGLFIIIGTVLLTHVGSDVQQSLLGLHNVYTTSSLGTSVHTVGNNFGQNQFLNNTLLFILWGTVGLVVYSIVQGALNELKEADKLLKELNYVHAKRNEIIKNVALRAAIRLGALIFWWFILRLLIFMIVPYAIAAAHISSANLTVPNDWLWSLIAGFACMIGLHILIVLTRLIFLRPRLFGEQIVI